MKTFDFHDAIITDIAYNGEILKLHLQTNFEQNGSCNYILETIASEYNVRFCYIRQFPWLLKVRYKIKEVDIQSVKLLFLHKKLRIVDMFYATYQSRFLLESDIIPCSAKRGHLAKMYLEISSFDNFNIIFNNSSV